MKNKHLLSLSTFFLICSCSVETTSDFTTLAKKELSFQEIPLDTIMKSPYQLEYSNNTLVMADNAEGFSVMLYDIEKSKFHKTLRIGQGPQEIQPPLSVSIHNDTVSILQRSNGICQDYTIDNLMNGTPAYFRKRNLKRSDRSTITNRGYASLGMYENGILSFFDRNGESIQEIDPYPWYQAESIDNKYLLFQGRICYSTEKDILMVAPSFASNIWFYHFQNNHWIKKDSVCISDGNFEKEAFENMGHMRLKKQTRRNTLDVCQSDHFFYVLYDGGTMGTTTPIEYRYVIRLDFEGHIDAVYKVDSTTYCIAITPDDSVLYVIKIGNEGEYVIAQTSLSKYSE